MNYEEKMCAVSSLVQSYNQAIPKEHQINADDFINCLKISGGTTDEYLKGFSYEDILRCLPTFTIPSSGSLITCVPTILAKEIAKIFRDKETNKPNTRRPDKMSIEELVAAFDPEDIDSSVGKRLQEVAKNQPFIVFTKNRTIDVETSVKLLQEVKKGFAGRTNIEVNDAIKKVYRIGELPDNLVDENPLYPNRPLRPDGTCDQTGRSWDGVSLETRQLVRLAVETNELIVNIENAHNILDIVMQPDCLKKLRIKYRKAAIKFDEKINLPQLKMVLNPHKTNPLSTGKKV